MKPSNRPMRLAGRQGFSLLELMVALTILAIALIPVAYFYSKSLQMVEEASIRTRALMLAQERIAEVRQMPYDMIRSNITPSSEQVKLYTGEGIIDTTASDWYGYDLEVSGTTPPQWQAMFFYPLPLDFNPYQPQTQGYNNALNVNHYTPFNPVTGLTDSHVNFNGGNSLDYEYEPIGFYTQKVYNRNRRLIGNDRQDIELADRRTLSVIEPSIAQGNDFFRSGNDQQVDN
ncbi:MAG TPA: prepilin-type N-terminal cleavage/methylation domain-containing protein, partial [Firmicutes bacterium]|nr:prepilin-type N-terminal cleavage/methylation domain-containing protein [Bacillota bacterium]